MKGKKSLFIVALTLAFGAIVASARVEASETVRFYVKMPNGYIPGVPVGDMLMVDVYVESPSEWYDTADGIVQWSVSVRVDPAVLEPMGVTGAKSGYFLKDYVDTTLDPFGFTYSVSLLPPSINKTAGIIKWITCGIMPDPPTGAGDSGKLITLGFKSLSETAYSPIDIHYDDDPDGSFYWTTGNVDHVVDIVEDGHYNEPTVEVHDVAVTDVTPSKAEVYPGWTIDVDVTVENEGDVTETFDVTVKYDDTTIGTPQTVTNLAPDASKALKFNWDTTGVTPCISYTVTAIAADVPEETDTADNSLSTLVKVKLAGDVDGSAKVDFRDLFDLAAAYGSTPVDANWNEQCDFDQSNKVDYEDLFDLAENYGTEYSCP